jgi:glycosyltransferase involved in cell wall biosynthesis
MNQLSPKVSVIIPSYNRANYIADTIKSVQDQSYKNWEMIILDDGSNDNTQEIVERIGDDKIHFIKNKRLGIVSAIKNLGIANSTGELIAFIDSDDLWAEDKLEKQVMALQQFPEAGFCLTNGYNFKNINEPLDFFYKQNKGFIYDNIFFSCFKSEVAGFTQALMFRRECINAAGLFKETKPFSDVDFIISLAKNFKAIILYEPLVFRRLHDANHMKLNWKKNYYQGIELIQEYQKELPGTISNNAFFRLYINFGESCLKHSEKKQAITKFLKAWKYAPFSIAPLKKIAKTLLLQQKIRPSIL